MAHAGSFRVPSAVAQDLAMILELVDSPQPQAHLRSSEGLPVTLGSVENQNRMVKSGMESDDDIGSSGPESENEVEAEIAAGPGSDGDGVLRRPSTVQLDELDSDSSDSECSSASSLSIHPRNGGLKRRPPPATDIDLDDDGPPPPDTYIPSAHELPSTAIPVPPLPDPLALPSDPLERVGEIATVLPDTIIVRGDGASGAGHMSDRQRRDAALDEGSLLLFEDRTMLGYVSETFGPTSLPHYVVRINRRTNSTKNKDSDPDPSSEQSDPTLSTPTAHISTAGEDMSMTSSSHPDGPDPTKLVVSQAVYHIPSLSTFVFPGALARLKGSDASNFHDEEPADHELEFSDDEAEAAFKRLRKKPASRASSRAPSVIPHEEDDSMSTIGDDAGSLYGVSPYDFDGSAYDGENDVPMPPIGMPDSSSSSTMFADPAVREALMHARNSRPRRSSSASIGDFSPTAGPSGLRYDTSDGHGRGRGRGRGRGNDRPRGDRGRGRNSRGRGRGRGQSNTSAITPVDRTSPTQTHGPVQPSSFSFEEYDPHMPRPPSPTSLAIARATGQWADGTPFPYQSGAEARGAIPSTNGGIQSPVQSYGLYESVAFNFPQGQQHLQAAAQYSVAPHINPRFAQALGFPGTAQVSSIQQNTYDFASAHGQPEATEHPSDRSAEGE